MESSTLLSQVQVGVCLVLFDEHLIPVVVIYVYSIVHCFCSKRMLNSISVMLSLFSI